MNPLSTADAKEPHPSRKGAKVFYLPVNAEGTEVRPMVYLRKAQTPTRS